MRKYWLSFKNLLVFTFIFVVFVTLQKTIWPTFFSTLPSPPLWLNFIVFIALYRPPQIGIFYAYFLGWILSFYSLAPLKMILFSIIIVYSVTLFIKSRLFMEGFFYFAVLSLVASVNFHLSWIILSHFFEAQSVPLHFVNRFIQILLTPALAIPTYYFLIMFDKFFLFSTDGETGPIRL